MKKADIIKILKAKGINKAVGRTVRVEALTRGRFISADGMEDQVAYDWSKETYSISASRTSITIEPVGYKQLEMIGKIKEALGEAEIKFQDLGGCLIIYR